MGRRRGWRKHAQREGMQRKNHDKTRENQGLSTEWHERMLTGSNKYYWWCLWGSQPCNLAWFGQSIGESYGVSYGVVDGLTVLLMDVVVIESVVVITIIYNTLLAVTFGAVGTFPGIYTASWRMQSFTTFRQSKNSQARCMYFKGLWTGATRGTKRPRTETHKRILTGNNTGRDIRTMEVREGTGKLEGWWRPGRRSTKKGKKRSSRRSWNQRYQHRVRNSRVGNQESLAKRGL